MSWFEELLTREKASLKPVLFSRRPFSMLLFPFFTPESSVFLSGCLLNSLQKNTDSHFANSASAIELGDFFRGNYYSALTGISKHGSSIFYLGSGVFKFFTFSAFFLKFKL